jgi:hypothetical protein
MIIKTLALTPESSFTHLWHSKLKKWFIHLTDYMLASIDCLFLRRNNQPEFFSDQAFPLRATI